MTRTLEPAVDLRNLEEALEASLAPHALLTHPFYRAWSDGCLGLGDLARYAEQYRHSVQALPALLRVAEAGTEDAESRSTLRRNLDEEEGRVGPAHAQLWEQFARAVGGEDRALPLPETAEAGRALTEAMGDDEVSQLAALWAYEVQTARVAETKEAGLRRYGVEAPEALAFFRMHGALDVHHARALLEALARALGRGGTLEQATAAVRRSAEAQWRFLDGVERLRQDRLAA
jgi:pyrroloquinoline-quinone synthase